jgi:hypothetical protein
MDFSIATGNRLKLFQWPAFGTISDALYGELAHLRLNHSMGRSATIITVIHAHSFSSCFVAIWRDRHRGGHPSGSAFRC